MLAWNASLAQLLAVHRVCCDAPSIDQRQDVGAACLLQTSLDLLLCELQGLELHEHRKVHELILLQR